MDGQHLLKKFKVSEIQIESNFDETENHDSSSPLVFSTKFWADPSIVSELNVC